MLIFWKIIVIKVLALHLLLPVVPITAGTMMHMLSLHLYAFPKVELIYSINRNSFSPDNLYLPHYVHQKYGCKFWKEIEDSGRKR